MTGKRFLKQIREIELIIDTYEEEYEILMSRLTSTTVKPKEVNVMSSKEDTLPEDIEELIELKKKINKSINEYAKMKIDAKMMVDQIENFLYQSVLIKYYFQHKTLEQISCEIDKTYQWTCELRDRALDEFEKIFQKNSVT